MQDKQLVVLIGVNLFLFLFDLADGQTGSGKTHSIMGVIPSAGENSSEELLNAEQQGQGAIPRAIEQIFSDLRLHQSNTADQAYGTLFHHIIPCHTFKSL